MKITIFPDYLNAIGGGKNVTIAMAKIPDADILTTEGLFNSSIDVVEYVGFYELVPFCGYNYF